MPSNKQHRLLISGHHVLTEALNGTPEAVTRVFLDPTSPDRELIKKLKQKNIKIDHLRTSGSREKSKIIKAELDPTKLILSESEFLSSLDPKPETGLLLLGEIQDPQNVGAVIRSAAAFGFSGILFPRHNQAPITDTVLKVSAGMAFRVPLVSIGNVNQTLRDLQNQGFWIYGLTPNGDQDLNKEDFDRPSVLVVGNEAYGIREKTLKHCDFQLTIPTHPRCQSLNAAASFAIVGYAWSRHHPEALRKPSQN